MDVAGSRRKTQVRVPPAILVVAAVAAIGALVYVTGSGTGSGPSAPERRVHRRPECTPRVGRLPGPRRVGLRRTAATTGFYLKSSVPAAGAQAVATNTTISLTFSEPVNLKKAAPVLSPKIGGTWVQSSPTTLAYRLNSPFIPATQETVTLPGGTLGNAGRQRDRIDGPLLHHLRPRRRRPAAGARAAGRAGLPPADLYPDRSGTRRRRPGPGPAGCLRLALARPAGPADVAVDPGHDERDHQGGGRGVRERQQPGRRR